MVSIMLLDMIDKKLMKKSSYVGYIGKIKRDCEKLELVTYSLFENKENGNIDLKCYRPLIVNKDLKIIENQSDILSYRHNDSKFKCNLYVGYQQNGIELLNEKVFYVEDYNEDKLINEGFEVNGFGRLNKFTFGKIDQIHYFEMVDGSPIMKNYKIYPLIMLKGTEQNIKKYGCNFISDDDVKYLLTKIVLLNKNK